MSYISSQCICGAWVANSDTSQVKHLSSKKHLEFKKTQAKVTA